MPARINPCFGCHFSKTCEARAEWSKKISGLGLRSVWFDCTILAAELRVGRRITVRAPVADYGSHGYEFDIARKVVKATITAIDTRHRFACVIDPGEIEEEDLIGEETDINKVRFWKYRNHWRVEAFLDEPDAVVCKFGNIRRATGCDQRADKSYGCMCDGEAANAKELAELGICT